MAPITEAIRTHYAFTRHDETHVYKKDSVDKEWTIGSVPHGGYMLAIVMDAALRHQSFPHKSSPVMHLDPAHLTAQFLAASSIAPLEVHIKTFSNTKRWTRLDISLCQPNPRAHIKGEPGMLLRIRAHALFTTLPKAPLIPNVPSPDSLWVLPNTESVQSRICPMLEHPGDCKHNHVPNIFSFKKYMKWFTGVKLVGSSPDEDGKKKLDWGCWFELLEEDVNVQTSAALMCLFADLFHNGPETLPKSQQPGPSWYPTLTFSLDFKAAFPLIPSPLSATKSSKIATRTVGLYSRSSFIHDGRHDQIVEVWTAPGAIGEKYDREGSEDWRKGAQILAISTQMALVLPFAVQKSQLAKETNGAKL